jgi:ssRNA-specific RNase YbeY (16S rRNA maturation enzyme)
MKMTSENKNQKQRNKLIEKWAVFCGKNAVREISVRFCVERFMGYEDITTDEKELFKKTYNSVISTVQKI